MNPIVRSIFLMSVGLLTYVALWLLLVSRGVFGVLSQLIPLLCAILLARYAGARISEDDRGLVGYVAVGAVFTGAIGFVAGFFGPMVFSPGANQGPLLGIFYTGPLGFVLGAVGGGIYWATRGR